mmetsp:Transcript_39567/g.99438  ORF Transcript_39567/g.99438 Transcript_39567/m.99438 type:complete len:314 (+) Transcript_39567:663-1604(+)
MLQRRSHVGSRFLGRVQVLASGIRRALPPVVTASRTTVHHISQLGVQALQHGEEVRHLLTGGRLRIAQQPALGGGTLQTLRARAMPLRLRLHRHLQPQRAPAGRLQLLQRAGQLRLEACAIVLCSGQLRRATAHHRLELLHHACQAILLRLQLLELALRALRDSAQLVDVPVEALDTRGHAGAGALRCAAAIGERLATLVLRSDSRLQSHPLLRGRAQPGHAQPAPLQKLPGQLRPAPPQCRCCRVRSLGAACAGLQRRGSLGDLGEVLPLMRRLLLQAGAHRRQAGCLLPHLLRLQLRGRARGCEILDGAPL